MQLKIMHLSSCKLKQEYILVTVTIPSNLFATDPVLVSLYKSFPIYNILSCFIYRFCVIVENLHKYDYGEIKEKKAALTST